MADLTRTEVIKLLALGQGHTVILAGVDLSNLDLNGLNFSYADLTGANLSGTNLRKADLSGAILSQTILTGADLTGANLDTDLTDVIK